MGTFSAQFMQLAQKNEKLKFMYKVYELNYKSAAEAGKNFKSILVLVYVDFSPI